MIPDSRELVSNYLLLYSFEGDTDYMSSYVNYEYTEAHLMVRIASMDVMSNGLVVMGARGHFATDTGTDPTPARFYYQVDPTSCYYDADSNTTSVDPSGEFLDPASFATSPQVVTQWDGSQDISHVLLMELQSKWNSYHFSVFSF